MGINLLLLKNVLFLHAITGCDTTSAFYRRGKTAVFKMFEKQDLVQCAEDFKKSNLTEFDFFLLCTELRK